MVEHLIKAKENLFLGVTDKRIFTEGKIYKVRPSTSMYVDGNIEDDCGFNHSVSNSFINEYFLIKE